MKDAIGQEIKVGDTVVYGDDVGGLHVAEVVGFGNVERVEIKYTHMWDKPRTLQYFTSADRVVVHNALKPEWNLQPFHGQQPETD